MSVANEQRGGGSMKGTSSTLGIERFDGSGLPLAKYRHWLETSILPEACQLAEEGDTIIAAIWRDAGSLWCVEPNDRVFESVVPLSVKRRTLLLTEITKLVGGEIVVVAC